MGFKKTGRDAAATPAGKAAAEKWQDAKKKAPEKAAAGRPEGRDPEDSQ
jgi:hypothetical protein